MKKLLTVAVPCYNVAWCLDKCLSSFLTEPVREELEIIIVNDGSTDDTLQVASKYVDMHPHIFRLIDKPNGGHGSTINEAIMQASGKYFKVVDADDWVITENLGDFLNILTNTEADAIITHFHTVDMESGNKKEHKTRNIQLNRAYALDEFTASPDGIYSCTFFHGLTYRTEAYRASGAILSEGIFYEDHEYATLPFLAVETIFPSDVFLYQYLVGNVNQSVSDQNQVKRLGHIEQVTKRLFCCYRDNPNVSEGKRRYIARKATDMLVSYYIVAMVKNPDKRGGRIEAARVRRELSDVEPVLVSLADARYRIAAIMSRLGITARILRFIKQSLPYAILYKLLKRNENNKIKRGTT